MALLDQLLGGFTGVSGSPLFHRRQLQTVLGEDQVQTMSRQSGMAPHDFLSQLSQHLPRVVDSMTSNGRVPDEGTTTTVHRAEHLDVAYGV